MSIGEAIESGARTNDDPSADTTIPVAAPSASSGYHSHKSTQRGYCSTDGSCQAQAHFGLFLCGSSSSSLSCSCGSTNKAFMDSKYTAGTSMVKAGKGEGCRAWFV